MGKMTFTPIQKSVFNAFIKSPISSQYYFTGGTALSVFYFHHRFSEDLDFFTEKPINITDILGFFKQYGNENGLTYLYTDYKNIHIISLERNKKPILKIDFVHHPFNRVEKDNIVDGFMIDSIIDIGANKIVAISQRIEMKDFVDLYYILQKYTLWDLLYAVEKKYRMKMDILLLGNDFLLVRDLTFLPKMTTSLTIRELQTFFVQKAKDLGSKILK